jgi:putative ABC transport system permease protein
MEVRLNQDAAESQSPRIQTQWRVVGGDYFRAVQIPLLRGRLFQQQDDGAIPRVTIISNNLAERLWPGEDPLGRHMLVGDARRPYQIVGVVGDIRGIGIDREAEPMMYFHYRQFGFHSMTLALRASNEPQNVAAAVRAKVGELDPELPVFELRPMQDLIGRASAEPRMNASLLGLFALLALLLAAIGIYGVMSYAVEQRTSEIGLRMALGAQTADVLRLVIGQGLWLAGFGIAAGLLGALAATRVLGSLLFQTSPTDPVTFSAVALVLAVVAVLSCYMPVRRAMRIDPMQALRHE